MIQPFWEPPEVTWRFPFPANGPLVPVGGGEVEVVVGEPVGEEPPPFLGGYFTEEGHLPPEPAILFFLLHISIGNSYMVELENENMRLDLPGSAGTYFPDWALPLTL